MVIVWSSGAIRLDATQRGCACSDCTSRGMNRRKLKHEWLNVKKAFDRHISTLTIACSLRPFGKSVPDYRIIQCA